MLKWIAVIGGIGALVLFADNARDADAMMSAGWPMPANTYLQLLALLWVFALLRLLTTKPGPVGWGLFICVTLISALAAEGVMGTSVASVSGERAFALLVATGFILAIGDVRESITGDRVQASPSHGE